MPAYFSTLADSDLEDIWNFIAKDSIEKANIYISKFIQRIHNLSIQSSIGIKRNALRKDIFSFPIDNYIVFYEIKSEEQIYIIRILHMSRDIQSIFIN